jgi:hypothetical protein
MRQIFNPRFAIFQCLSELHVLFNQFVNLFVDKQLFIFLFLNVLLCRSNLFNNCVNVSSRAIGTLEGFVIYCFYFHKEGPVVFIAVDYVTEDFLVDCEFFRCHDVWGVLHVSLLKPLRQVNLQLQRIR